MDKPPILAVALILQDLNKTESLPFVRGGKSGLEFLEGSALFRPHMPRAGNTQADVRFCDEPVAFATQFIGN